MRKRTNDLPSLAFISQYFHCNHYCFHVFNYPSSEYRLIVHGDMPFLTILTLPQTCPNLKEIFTQSTHKIQSSDGQELFNAVSYSYMFQVFYIYADRILSLPPSSSNGIYILVLDGYEGKMPSINYNHSDIFVSLLV